MRKIQMLFMGTVVAMVLTACGGKTTDTTTSSSTAESAKVETTAAPTQPVTTVAETVPADDGIIDYQNSAGSTLKFTKYEVTQDYENKPAIGLYFDYTNNQDEAAMVLVDFGVKVFQGGVECNTAIVTNGSDESTNSTKEIKPGVTLPVCMYFELNDTNSELEVEVGDWISLSGEVDTQIIELTNGNAPSSALVENAETQSAESESATDGVINFKDSVGSTLVYSKHVFAEDYQGKPALLVYFDYTNNSDTSQAAMYSYSVKAYQNGIECGVGVSTTPPEEYQNTLKEIKKGNTLSVCWQFSLIDDSAIEIEVGTLFGGVEATQTINFE